MSINSARDITALILAGGQAARMGGADKGLIECAGRPLIEWVLDKVTPMVGSILISANRNLDRYNAYGHAVLNDTCTDYQGPLAGIERGLDWCGTDYLWVVPCDAPAFTAELLRRLIRTCVDTQCLAAVPYEGKYAHPTFVLLHVDTLSSLQDFLAAGRRKVLDWLATLPATQVDCSDHPEWFINVNTPDELEHCRTLLRRSS